MPKQTDPRALSRRERQIMDILYRRGRAAAADVRAELPGDPSDSTVRTQLRVLEEKGHVRHEPEGRAYRYFPTVAADEAGRTALGRIVNKIFQGSAEMTLARLVEERRIPREELDRMRRILDEISGEEGEEGGRP
jgi:BlaI family transcriptional regulator, penicillinase repressor